MNESDYMTDRLDDQIGWYSDQAGRCQKKYKSHRVAQIILAATLPVVATIGYLNIWSWVMECFPVIASTIGASISVSVSISTLCKYHEHWIQYRTTAESLKHQKYLYLTKTAPYHEDDRFPRLVTNVESLISKENTQWNIHQQSNK